MANELAVQWQEAFNAGDAAGVAALYTADGVLHLASGEVARGPDAVQAWAQAQIDAGLTIEIVSEASEVLADEIVYGSGTWAFLDGEGQQVLAGKWAAVDMMDGDAWKVHRHFASVPYQLE
ncbi:MAG: nuclear transport factor 2 family protein [Trueperaceae bacterium]|nr:nuclear transport factor 2 family protein [Trueperaceae bacterium]